MTVSKKTAGPLSFEVSFKHSLLNLIFFFYQRVFDVKCSPLWFYPAQSVRPAWPLPVPESFHAAPRFPTPSGSSSSAPPLARCTGGVTRSLQPAGEAQSRLRQ